MWYALTYDGTWIPIKYIEEDDERIVGELISDWRGFKAGEQYHFTPEAMKFAPVVIYMDGKHVTV